MSLYPVFLDLRDARVVIVGGGPVAASKLDGLLAAGARRHGDRAGDLRDQRSDRWVSS